MSLQFRANGKLLISGEYAVLLGAEALAFPTRYGQTLLIQDHTGDHLKWTSLDHEENIWFEARFDRQLNILFSTDQAKAEYLKNLMDTAFQLVQAPIPGGLHLTTRLEFPNDWGLGSSSTLVHLIAQWTGADPIRLFKKTSTGSGYDVACAGASTPITYALKNDSAIWRKQELPQAFNRVLFVHLNQKQLSKPEVLRFKKAVDFNQYQLLAQVNSLTHTFLTVKSESELQEVMDAHEALLSPALQLPTIKEKLFSDFKGSVKSLGAWGGDFVMAIGPEASQYFSRKGFHTQLSLKQMALI